MEILQACSFYRTLDLNELTNLIDVVIDVRRDREAMKKWKGTKILDWDDVVEQLENIHELNPFFV